MAAPEPPANLVLRDVRLTNHVLGRGSYGAVYLAKLRGAKVAVKYLYPILMRDERGRYSDTYRRFLQEIERHGQLRHPNVASLLGVVPASGPDGSPGIVLEHLSQTLRQRYGEQPGLSRLDETSIARDVACGLDYLHSRQFIHRDLTTNNIMLSCGLPGACQAKITDVGGGAELAVGEVTGKLTVNPGNQTYMAPETFSRDAQKVEYGSAADCYSYGVSIMSMLLKREPPNIFVLAREGHGADISKLPDGHPLRDVVVSCLEADPGRRPLASVLSQRTSAAADEVASAMVNSEARTSTRRGQEESEVATLRQRLADVDLATQDGGSTASDAARVRRSHAVLTRTLIRERTPAGMLARCLQLSTGNGSAPVPDLAATVPKWNHCGNLPGEDRFLMSVAVHSGHLYTTICTKEVVCQLQRIALDKLSDGEWEGLNQHGFEWISVFTHGDDLYSLGADKEEQSWIAKWNGKQWDRVVQHPRLKFAPLTCAHGSSIFVIGGKGLDDCSSVYSLDLCAVDKGWERWPDLPVNTILGSAVSIGECIHLTWFIVHSTEEKKCGNPLSLDTSLVGEHRNWSPSAVFPSESSAQAACMANGYIVAAGGADTGNNTTRRQVSMLEPDSGIWLPLPELNFTRGCAHLLYHGGRLICIGGMSELREGTVRQIEILQL